MTLIETYEKITEVLTELKEGYTTPDNAHETLTKLAAKAKKALDIKIAVPSATELEGIHRQNYESSYQSS